MHCFKDPAGASWPVTINLFAVEQVKAAHGVDLPGLFGDQARPLGKLLGDDALLCKVVYALGQPDNEKAGRTLDDLKRAWAGETADGAVRAFTEELADFFRDPERRTLLRNVLKKFEDLGRVILTQGAAQLEAVDAEELIRLLKSSGPGPSGSAGSTAASSESIRVATPSASST